MSNFMNETRDIALVMALPEFEVEQLVEPMTDEQVEEILMTLDDDQVDGGDAFTE